MTTTRPVVILGGGIAGLVAARDLGRRGVRSIVLEAGTAVGGLAATKRDADGFSYDVGAHFITNRLAAAVGLGHACRRVSHYGETVWLRGRSFDYPFGLALRPRYALSALAGRLGGRVESAVSAAEWFRASYGRSLADEVAIPLLEAWSGLPAEQLAAAVGGNIPSSIAATMFRRSVARMSHRAVAIGYSHEAAERVGVFHVYPEEGASAICGALAKNQTADIRLETPVERIHLEGERVVGVTAAGIDLDVRAVVSTLPVDVLSLLAPDATALVPVKRFRYRSMVFVNLRLRGRGLLPEVVTWTPEHQFPFFRLTEAPISMPMLAPQGKTIILADIGCEVGDATWTADDAELGERCVASLEPIVPGARQRYLGCTVIRTRLAYPVYDLDYEDQRQAFARSTGVRGLASIGRNGEFAHLLMEDIYWRSGRHVGALLASTEGNDARSSEPR